MPLPPSGPRSTLASLAVIAAICIGATGALAYTAGWLSPDRLTPTKLVDALAPPTGPVPGYRRNHAKGICFTGSFAANGNGTALSRARVFETGAHPALGRFNLGTPDPGAPDTTVRVRGLGLQITADDGAVWRAAMINAPVFPVSTPEAFYELLRVPASKAPNAMAAFVAAHPEFSAFGAWAKSPDWTASYAQEPYNSLDAFLFTDAAGAEQAVRWSFRPEAPPERITPEAFGKRGPASLEQEITDRVAAAPQRWTLVLTVADPGDPTADPSRAWPEGRRSVEAGTLVVQRIEPEADGPCRDINFDPTILPDGIRVSDDPFPAARSAAYARSYDLRTAEAKDYPKRTSEAAR
ncbi:catalase family peroxidase [Methylobacterium sp. J-077]|uniref:catalase family peroxidase n=1 Tax=Methylobacterium sp. J-077 TaxID=2836656 RepID=UPI001FBAD7E4|nr:catalase family peroxidase [Methylobacterium sp. J-077]MCJ2127128.1 catalase family peroxidase [Methylobacterium sp. J-077]